MEHIGIPTGERHPAHNFEFTNAAQRTAAVITDADAVRTLALQLDDESFWLLTSIDPVIWVPVSNKNSDTTATQPVWGKERLRRWQSWMNAQDRTYDLIIQGDDIVDGNYFAKALKNELTIQGFDDGGVGFLSFANADSGLASQSIDASKLSCSWTTGDWATSSSLSWGVDGTDTVSTGANKTIVITSTEAIASLTLVYKTGPASAGFNYRINSGATVPVSTTNAIVSAGTTVIDTSSFGVSFTVTITALGAGVSFSGAVGRKSIANSLTVHKAGQTGSQAGSFGRGPLFASAGAPLIRSHGGVMFLWGTNDAAANVSPTNFKTYIQGLVNYWRAIDPVCDLIFVGPPRTSIGTETTTTYTVAQYNDVMFQMAKENSGAAFVGFEQIFGAFNQAQVDAGFIHADRIHPGTYGKELIVKTLSDLLLS